METNIKEIVDKYDYHREEPKVGQEGYSTHDSNHVIYRLNRPRPINIGYLDFLRDEVIRSPQPCRESNSVKRYLNKEMAELAGLVYAELSKRWIH